MPEPRHEHGSKVVPVGDYVPGARPINPAGLSKGVAAIPADHIPPPPRPRRPTQPPKHVAGQKGRPVGSKNRKAPTEDMFDGPSEPQ